MQRNEDKMFLPHNVNEVVKNSQTPDIPEIGIINS